MTETRELTDQQKKEYIEQGGMLCPVCKSPDVSTDPCPDVTEHGIYINCQCEDCSEEWIDRYALTDVELAESAIGIERLFQEECDFDMDGEFKDEEEVDCEGQVNGHADDDWTDLSDK